MADRNSSPSPLAGQGRGGGAARTLRADRRAAAALEFAVVALVFVTMLFGIIEVAFDLYVQAVLDSAVQTAARSVQTGNAQGTSGETSATFAAAAVCPALSGLLHCSLVTVGVETIASGYNFYTNPTPLTYGNASSGGGAVCTGVGGQMMLLTAWYRGPTFIGSLVPSFSTRISGSLVHLTSSSVGFVNEWFSGGQTVGTGC